MPPGVERGTRLGRLGRVYMLDGNKSEQAAVAPQSADTESSPGLTYYEFTLDQGPQSSPGLQWEIRGSLDPNQQREVSAIESSLERLNTVRFLYTHLQEGLEGANPQTIQARAALLTGITKSIKEVSSRAQFILDLPAKIDALKSMDPSSKEFRDEVNKVIDKSLPEPTDEHPLDIKKQWKEKMADVPAEFVDEQLARLETTLLDPSYEIEYDKVVFEMGDADREGRLIRVPLFELPDGNTLHSDLHKWDKKEFDFVPLSVGEKIAQDPIGDYLVNLRSHVAILFHDVGNPLGAIHGYLQFMERAQARRMEMDWSQQFDSIIDSVGRGQRVLNRTLDALRGETHRQPFTMPEFFEELKDSAKPFQNRKIGELPVAVIFDELPAELRYLNFKMNDNSKDLIEDVGFNAIDNGFKGIEMLYEENPELFASQQNQVRVSVDVQRDENGDMIVKDGKAMLQVRFVDTGTGIYDEDLLKKGYKRGLHSWGKEKRKDKGSGIGMETYLSETRNRTSDNGDLYPANKDETGKLISKKTVTESVDSDGSTVLTLPEAHGRVVGVTVWEWPLEIDESRPVIG